MKRRGAFVGLDMLYSMLRAIDYRCLRLQDQACRTRLLAGVYAEAGS
jgi:hypothetical protein